MEKTAQATLSAPITVQGKKTDILTLRRATLGDDEDDIGAIRAAHNSLRPTKPKKKEEAETATATTQGEGSTASA